MLRTVLWISAACLAVLLALWLSRGVEWTSTPAKAPVAKAPAVAEVAAKPAAEKAAKAQGPVAAKVERMPDEVQVQEDAAATGMTTAEPEEQSAPTPPPEPEMPPT